MTGRAWLRLLAALLILAMTLLFFHQLVFSGKILARGDTFQYFYPYWDARNDAFRAGRLPLWTPDLFMGAPLLANPQLGVFYPLNWLTAPFRAPAAIALSIILHAALAAAGTVCLYRQAVSKQWIPALAAGAVYAFGGAVSAHIEQINQLQGLAWMPLLFLLVHRLLAGPSPRRDALLLALAWALQIFSGHTQTVFISGIGLAVYALGFCACNGGPRASLRRLLLALLPLALSFLGALVLALPQLLPSLEQLQLSNRSGGLSAQAATAFSLSPALLGRALLPSYDGQLFSEYIASPGVIGLGLALWGMLSTRENQRHRVWILLALVGMALALGRYNPLYLLLAELPGFNLFRVPARFLALFSLGMALLAGMGLQALSPPLPSRKPIFIIAGAIALLIGLTRFLLPGNDEIIFGGAAISDGALALWIGAWLALLAILALRHRRLTLFALALLAAELFVAGKNLPFNDLAPPDVYFDEREPVSQLRALQATQTAPSRTLSASQIYFDPLDIADLRRRYDRLGMDWRAQFHALDAVKMQETLYPNLALTWGLPSTDGFGGGIAPSRAYTLFSSLLLPSDEPLPIDGRLGERMAVPRCWGACLPERRWLEATDTLRLVTDRVYDIWHDDIRYDTALARYWADAATTPALPDFADEVRILHREPLNAGLPALKLEHDLLLTIIDSADLPRMMNHAAGFLAVTAVDSRQPGSWLELQPPPFQRSYAGAVKIFSLPTARQRAFLAAETRVVADTPAGDEAALQLLRDGASVVLHGDMQPLRASLDGSETVEFLTYGAERATLAVTAPAESMLVLAEAWHPGWRATVNGEPTAIHRANLMFRALRLPAGENLVSFEFAPQNWFAALYIGIGLWFITLLMLFALSRPERYRRNRQRRPKETEP